MQETQASIFDDNESFMLQPRRELLPWWIIFFSWLTLVISALHFLATFLQLLGVDLIGFIKPGAVTKKEFFLMDIVGLAMSLYAIIVSYGLLKEKDWAVKVAIVYVFVGVASTVYTIIDQQLLLAEPAAATMFWITYSITFFMYGLFLWKLITIRKEWDIRAPRSAQ